MRQEPVPQEPGRDEDPSGVAAGPGNHPWLGSPDWRLVPQSPDWDEAYLAARAEDEYPGDLEEYEDPDHARPVWMTLSSRRWSTRPVRSPPTRPGRPRPQPGPATPPRWPRSAL
jgi:hypothetical protein